MNLGRYETVEECLAATGRVADRVEELEKRRIWRDTMPWDPREVLLPLPPRVTEMARRCGSRFGTVETVLLQDFPLLLDLYLQAGWDDRAAALVSRRLGELPLISAAQRTALIDSVVAIYLSAQPKRFAAVELLVADRLRPGEDPATKLTTLALLAANRDTVRARRYAEQLVATARSLTPIERDRIRGQRRGAQALNRAVLLGLNILTHQPGLDSLRRNTSAYLALKKANLSSLVTFISEATQRSQGGQPAPTVELQFGMGKRAPQISGDFWVGSDKASGVRPTRGKVGLVVFLDQRHCGIWNETYGCRIVPAILRRLAARFPTLEVTLVGHTSGSFMYLPPVTPTEEGKLIDQWLRGAQIPGAYAVTRTEFFRLPDPDRRRINRQGANVDNYASAEDRRAYLVDQDGIIVYGQDLERRWEPEFAELIEVLIQRETAKSGR